MYQVRTRPAAGLEIMDGMGRNQEVWGIDVKNVQIKIKKNVKKRKKHDKNKKTFVNVIKNVTSS